MKIERERVRETFREYTDAYDATDEKIKLKIDHTYRVAELSVMQIPSIMQRSEQTFCLAECSGKGKV